METNHISVKFRGNIGMKQEYNSNDFTTPLISNYCVEQCGLLIINYAAIFFSIKAINK